MIWLKVDNSAREPGNYRFLTKEASLAMWLADYESDNSGPWVDKAKATQFFFFWTGQPTWRRTKSKPADSLTLVRSCGKRDENSGGI